MHTYEVNLKWTGNTKGILSSPVLPQNIEVSTPPDFPKGIPGIWSPEHLFIASINSCVMSTFLNIAENSKLHFISFDCKSSCTVDLVEGVYVITEVFLYPILVIPHSEKPDRAKRIVEMSEKACMVSNTLKIPIQLETEIIVEKALIPIKESF
jgi:organic hydroperoxide reductase OsmC/OhrA